VEDDLIAKYRTFFENYAPGEVARVPYWAATEKAVRAAVRSALAGTGVEWNWNRDGRGRLIVVFPDRTQPRAKPGTPKHVSRIVPGGAIEGNRRRH